MQPRTPHPRTPHPRTPRSDPSKSRRAGGPSKPDSERQRRDQQSQTDLDPVGERGPDPRSDTHEDEI